MTSTRTIDALLVIMDDPDMMTHRRVEAAEAILGFEAPEAAVVRAREFLIEVFENAEEGIADTAWTPCGRAAKRRPPR